jgi:multicomponent K+:H+ antiporter subunit F
MIRDVALYFSIGCFAIGMVINMWVVVTSPRSGDRILALDTMVINSIALVILYGVLSRTAVYFELSLIIAMVGFISTVAYARHLLRGNVIE